MSVVEKEYLKLYTKSVSEGVERYTAFRNATDVALLHDACDFDKKLTECRKGDELKYANFLKTLLSPHGDLGKIMSGPASDLLKGLSTNKLKIIDVVNAIKRLLPFYDPIENQNLLITYFWKKTLPDSEPLKRAENFDKVSRIAGLKFNPSTWSNSDDAPEVSYNDDPASRHKLILLASMIGIPEEDCCSPKNKSMEAMLKTCESILKNGVDYNQQEKINQIELQLKERPIPIDRKNWRSSKVQMSRGQALSAASKGVIAGLLAFGLIYTYNKANQPKKA